MIILITPGEKQYEVVLQDKYYLRDLVESITLEESLDEIAYRANISLVVTDDFPSIVPGQLMRVSGVPFDGDRFIYLLRGVVWSIDSENRGQKKLNVTVYDPAKYLSESEEEYLLPAGQTASQRIQKYCTDWQIPIYNIPNTQTKLAKAVYRAGQYPSIYSMIENDLKETVEKGGSMYRPRMTPAGLELVEIGSNENVWVFETGQNIDEVDQRRTLEGTVTKVKVLGKAPEDKRSPVLATEEKDTDKYGTLQKVIQDNKITNAGDAKSKAQEVLAGVQEKFTIRGIDINTIRAGDKVILNNFPVYVTSVRHNLGSPGTMVLECTSLEKIRRDYYTRPI